jgi:hypothetical protein
VCSVSRNLRGRQARIYLNSSVAQRQSIRLLTGGLLVRIQPEEPILDPNVQRLCNASIDRDFSAITGVALEWPRG